MKIQRKNGCFYLDEKWYLAEYIDGGYFVFNKEVYVGRYFGKIEDFESLSVDEAFTKLFQSI